MHRPRLSELNYFSGKYVVSDDIELAKSEYSQSIKQSFRIIFVWLNPKVDVTGCSRKPMKRKRIGTNNHKIDFALVQRFNKIVIIRVYFQSKLSAMWIFLVSLGTEGNP